MKFKKLINNSVKELLFAQTDARILVSNYINSNIIHSKYFIM